LVPNLALVETASQTILATPEPLIRFQQMQNTVLLKDSQWGAIDGELCLVTDFRPTLGRVEQGVAVSADTTFPYAAVSLTCKGVPDITGFITHKVDFQNLWAIFEEREVSDQEEVLMYWTRTHYKNFAARFLSATMPKVIVIVSEKGTYKSVQGGFPLKRSTEVIVCVYALNAIEWRVPEVIR